MTMSGAHEDVWWPPCMTSQAGGPEAQPLLTRPVSVAEAPGIPLGGPNMGPVAQEFDEPQCLRLPPVEYHFDDVRDERQVSGSNRQT